MTDQNNQPLEIEDRTNLTLVINDIAIIKMRYSTETRDRTYVESYAFLSFAKNIGKIVVNTVKNFLIVLKHLQQMQ